ncbi:MAG: bifunctional 5,10-methylenetetrahydrofolate dehydrogenase/5,10-methenyltetrahydrofolate cyclohydrolase [Candidatus Gracilibacteria bacterium]|nr:bifunctional 5,10-methylenetetrahydrofolate dehydrogenase/5,10-methenyltetrahydrofolate cyclohydrolase [Candidatus Gracilibacteria bacterium]
MLIDGTSVALHIYDKIKAKVANMDTKPTLGAILVGNSPASLRYIKQKKKWADYTGVNFKLLELDADISEKKLLKKIEKFNEDVNISGYIVQLPLPKHIDENNVINAIKPEKDVDGFHPINQGKVLIGDKSGLEPCTPAGIIKILKSLDMEFHGQIACVIGRSNIVGKPVSALLINEGATVITCNSSTPFISDFTKKADIVVIAVGKPELLKENMLKKGSIVIDVGFTVVNEKIYGDADTVNIDKAGHRITPVPGGVGPLTVAMLMKNTLKAAKKSKI